ncbi:MULTISPECIES: VOC family protein [Arthrobacter]|uniref:VOC family protein n=1 Tax=Arthrobacter caoxuetaonis TaxID=2886935 RepID=A0A9X1SBC8_9MICC|nr:MULTISPECIES: VOC family protein [Arthrobacter]MCC3281351.1 VOC family protein [Arthrobacter caoxuetaonis]MCC3296396.1 VOC family protein [Arthrobacter caoxuetaonis]MCC9192472.1 VOC family protein [Arthrobacter sp. zg-Y916]USQ56763.1 VOC family protein [Arthrobacter caoxuetaonis]
MAYDIQICIDCENAHAQADWWAQTLGWPVEEPDQDFIDEMLAKGYAAPEDLIEHNGVRMWNAGSAILQPVPAGSALAPTRILFQPVPEPKTVKDRIHLDIRLAGDDVDATRSALEARGAKFLWEARQGPHLWYTMADPEGNEFCIS